MAFRVVRLRREARRNAKLEEIFAVRERGEREEEEEEEGESARPPGAPGAAPRGKGKLSGSPGPFPPFPVRVSSEARRSEAE